MTSLQFFSMENETVAAAIITCELIRLFLDFSKTQALCCFCNLEYVDNAPAGK